MSRAPLEVFSDSATLADGVAAWLTGLAKAKIGPFAVCLSGGSTPKRLYQRLASAGYRDRFPWPRAQWFWGDERFVPPGDQLSNFRMVREAMLAHAPIPPENIHSVPTTGLTPEAAATAYEKTLQSFYGARRLEPGRPLFDVTLLGLGPDGHTASLFPGDGALKERERWVVAVIGAKAEARISLTYPALESSADIAFLVEGAEKRDVFTRLRAGDPGLPAGQLHSQGRLHFFADSAAVD
ncbi:MAG TPA: 6-phosphogluconolactonase [Dongiaceae bacterium]